MQPADPTLLTLTKWIEVVMRRSMSSFICYAKENGLSMSQIGALFHIFHGKSSVSDIGDFLGVTNAASSQLLERLVQQGLVLRTEDPNDRRFKRINLTDEGRDVICESIAARQGWMEKLVATLDDAQRQQISAALTVLIEKAYQLDQQ